MIIMRYARSVRKCIDDNNGYCEDFEGRWRIQKNQYYWKYYSTAPYDTDFLNKEFWSFL